MSISIKFVGEVQLMKEIYDSFDLDPKRFTIDLINGGLINATWRLKNGGEDLILQRINTEVFGKPQLIAENIQRVSVFLKKNFPGYLFPHPVPSKYGNELEYIEGRGWYRLTEFIPNSHTVATVQNDREAYEAARQFGKFTQLLANFPTDSLNITIPDFHNLPLRYEQFIQALQQGNKSRIAHADFLIRFLKSHQDIVKTYKTIIKNPAWKQRVTHHDTKISNVLFDDKDNGLCVIDLDTLMPGYFISDVGDMMRTYLSPVSEEEKDYSLIHIRHDIFEAVWKGYMDNMDIVLSTSEKKYFLFSGRFMIYMQALRFLTDYLNDDVYYGQQYEGHNWVRAGNQARLLGAFIAEEPALQSIIDRQSL